MSLSLPRSLSARLVATTVALVAVIALTFGTATTLAMQSLLTRQLDEKVLASAARANQGPPHPPSGGPADLAHDLDKDPARFGNQEPGTLVALPEADTGEVLSDRPGEGEPLSDAVLELLKEVPVDGAVHEIALNGYGDYRLTAVDTEDGVLVTGLPTAAVDATVGSLLRWEGGLALAGVLLAALAANLLVRRQLRPLTQVAATAHAVSQTPLDSGEIGVTGRVSQELTDPRTEVGQVGTALNTLLAHVESSLSARHHSEQQVRQFVADASHELRTPLTTIAGYTELARRRGDVPTMAAALAKVQDESARMTALVEDLLLLARLDAGRPLAREDVDLTRLVVEAVDDARVVAPGHRWRVVIPEDGAPVETTGDAHRLHQAITNLLSNAQKYTPEGTTVTVSVRPDGFDVHDDGPGFPPHLVATAFERFTRGDASRHREGGAGLGLSIVEAIVTAHGGGVTLVSAPGDTVVAVRLPAAHSPAT